MLLPDDIGTSRLSAFSFFTDQGFLQTTGNFNHDKSRTMKLQAYAFFLLLWPTQASTVKAPIYIGGFFPLSPNKASVPGRALLAAAELALDHVNSSDILRDYELRMIVKDSKVREELNCKPATKVFIPMAILYDLRSVNCKTDLGIESR